MPHLHIDSQDQPSDWLSKALKSAREGRLAIDFGNEPAVRIIVDNGNVAVDLLRPSIFKMQQDETGLFDKLKTASEFGRKLSDNGVTLSFLRNGKEAVRLGKDARPTLSKLVTRSDDLQMTSAREFAGLKGDLKPTNSMLIIRTCNCAQQNSHFRLDILRLSQYFSPMTLV